MDKRKIIFILIIIICVIISIIAYIKENTYDETIEEDIFVSQNVSNNNSENFEANSEVSAEKIKIHITGEVASPGLYDLNDGDRINDLILLAGGVTENADLNKVNLAYELSDGEKIYIPSIFDETSTYIYNDAGENVSESSKNSSKSNKININNASSQDLQQISGIGPSLAEKIISYRNSNGKFSSIDELKNVSGIGDKKFETIKEYVSIK